jgi:hypothetical protein
MATMRDHYLGGTGQWKKSAEQADREYKRELKRLKKKRIQNRTPLLGAVPLRLRFAASCNSCRTRLEADTKAWFNPKAPNGKRITCSACHSPTSDKGFHKGFDGSAKITDSDGKPI